MRLKNIIRRIYHVRYQDYNASFDIRNAELLNGKMPSKQIRMVQAWIEIHKEELLADWQLCQNKEKPSKIKPLR